MSFENLMRTTEYLNRLDPLRPALRRLARIRFDEQQFSEFLEDLERWPQWRFSPTARFLASKAYVQLGQPGVADEHRKASWLLWEETREDEAPLSEPDSNRLELSYIVLESQIATCRGNLDVAERQLSDVEQRLDDCRTEDDAYDDFDRCVALGREALTSATYTIRPRAPEPRPSPEPEKENRGLASVTTDVI